MPTLFLDSSPEQQEARKRQLRRVLERMGIGGGRALPNQAENTVRTEDLDRKKQSLMETVMANQKNESAMESLEERAGREETSLTEDQIESAEDSARRRRRRLRRRQRG
jgi:hypothetical protein